MDISLAAEKIGHIGAFPITNTLIMSWVVVAFLISMGLLARRKLSLVPHGVQNVVEALLEGAFDFMDTIVLDRKRTRAFFPLVFTFFIIILFSNLIEIVPGLGTIGVKALHEGKDVVIPFIRSMSADLNFTLALAIVSVISVQVFGMIAVGVIPYGKRYINFSSPINFFVGILELISEFSRMISYSFRLFGNIFAGEVLLTIVLSLMPYAAPLPFLGLEIFVGFVQALVFCMLTIVFLTLATTAEEHH